MRDPYCKMMGLQYLPEGNAVHMETAMGRFVFLHQQVTELRNSVILTAVLLKTPVSCLVTLCLWADSFRLLVQS
jgi:hypothetical protein